MLKIINTKIACRWTFVLTCIFLLTACNNEWEDEQYIKYLSFVKCGLNKVYLKYEAGGGEKTYKIPIQVSGSQIIDKDVNVTVAVDMDTLQIYNYENFRLREDLYFKQLDAQYYNFNSMSTIIPAGTEKGYLGVNFSFLGLDNYDNYVLPLKIEPSSDLIPNPNKHYRKSLMHIILFNDYSGKYQMTSEIIEFDEDGKEKNEKIKVENRNTWVVDENTIFFYAGFTDEKALDRKEYRIYAKFFIEGGETTGKIELSCDNPDINFEYESERCYFTIIEEMDPVQPYLMRRYIKMDVSYTYYDISNPDYPAKYKYVGPMIMERVLNILMPEEDQIIWE